MLRKKTDVMDLKTEFVFRHELWTLRAFAGVGYGASGDVVAIGAVLRCGREGEAFWMSATVCEHGSCATDVERGG
jgi:hypothetical protein